jgi:nitrile hydratase
MNGIHDMGGMQDMGPIVPQKHEPVFHAPWEARVFALDLAMPGAWTESGERYQLELIPPADYLLMSYYQKWLTSLMELTVKSGLLTRTEIESGKPALGSRLSARALKASDVAPMLAKGSPSARNIASAARFHVGQRVRSRDINPVGHTRLPRYARGKAGMIARDHGVHVFSDTDAHGLGEKPQHVYSVRFDARELWGDAAGERDAVYVDLWDDHLESG